MSQFPMPQSPMGGGKVCPTCGQPAPQGGGLDRATTPQPGQVDPSKGMPGGNMPPGNQPPPWLQGGSPSPIGGPTKLGGGAGPYGGIMGGQNVPRPQPPQGMPQMPQPPSVPSVPSPGGSGGAGPYGGIEAGRNRRPMPGGFGRTPGGAF